MGTKKYAEMISIEIFKIQHKKYKFTNLNK